MVLVDHVQTFLSPHVDFWKILSEFSNAAVKSLILELFDFICKVSFRVDATRFAPNLIKKTNLELSYQYKSKNVWRYTIRLHETGFRIFENIVISDIFFTRQVVSNDSNQHLPSCSRDNLSGK